MHQIAFHLGSLEVHWYGIMVALGYLASVLAMLWTKRYAKLTTDQVFDFSMITIVAGIAGARIFYVLQFWHRDGFADNPLSIVRIDKGGLVFYGGFICALIGIWLYCRMKKFAPMKIMDMMVPGLAVGHAFGRIGCFLQGCCFGRPCGVPWAVEFPHGAPAAMRYPDPDSAQGCSLPVHPTQLYECVANFAIFGILMALGGRLKPGCLSALYLLLYGVMRFTVECFRGDHTDHVLGVLTPSQAISVFLIIPLGLILFVWLWRKDAKRAA